MSATVAIERQTVFDEPHTRSEELSARRGQVRFLRVPAHRFVMLDGVGPPAETLFGERLPALYGAAYSLHFALKRRAADTRVGPLEGLWWSAGQDPELDGSDWQWRWTLMIGLPDEATDAELVSCLGTGRAKVSADIATGLRVERFEEGRCAQLLHVGPYAEERPSIETLLDAIRRDGLTPRGRHHEIYLGDPRRSAPERLRTVLRQPVV